MHCNNKNFKLLEVETDKAFYDIELGPIQIEITGRCNMHCKHCRANEMPSVDMPIHQILKIIKFARTYSPSYKEVTISGGEPTLHNDFLEIIRMLRENGVDYLTITTNGSKLDEHSIDFLQSLNFDRLMISVSVDSANQAFHDSFRGHPGAFSKAIHTLKNIAIRDNPKLVPSMKTVVLPKSISEMEQCADLAHEIGCKRLSFTSVIYSGKAKKDHEMWMNGEEKRTFLENIYRLKKKYSDMNITTNDPLKCLVRGSNDTPNSSSEIVMDGCPAGTVSFNVNSDGTMTPCSLLNVPMMNIFNLTVEEIAKNYVSNAITKKFLDMDLNGKCNNCIKKYLCSGCRARAITATGDIMGEDPECWL